MKLDAVLAALAPHLTTDKSPDELARLVLAADRKAKDAAGSGVGPKEIENEDHPKSQTAKDRAAAQDEAEEAEDECAEAMDAKMAAHDSEEEEKDKEAKDEHAKDRKSARDARKGARDKRKGARDSRKTARDARKAARDNNTLNDPMHTNPRSSAASGTGGTRGALDNEEPSHIPTEPPGGNRGNGNKATVDSAEVDRRIAAAVQARDALHTALREVEPVLGTVTFDTAGDAYKAALKHLGVDAEGVHVSALRSMLAMAKDRAKSAVSTPAMDAAAASGLGKVIPGYNRLK
jgi:hypothetical protein